MADWNWKGNLEDIELDYCFDISSGKYQIVSILSCKYLKGKVQKVVEVEFFGQNVLLDAHHPQYKTMSGILNYLLK